MAKSRYHTVLFDLDGITYRFGKRHYPQRKARSTALRHRCCMFGTEGFCRAAPQIFIYGTRRLTQDEAEEAIRIYRERYRDKGIYENEVYEGIFEVLNQLQDANVTLGCRHVQS